MSLLKINILGNATSLIRALGKASSHLQKFSGKVKAVSGQMSALSIPLGIAGLGAVRMADDFDRSMTKIKSLVGVAGDQVDAMAPKVKQMATAFGVSATDSADALFFITSAGLRGSRAMQVLEASLKASAVGLGQTKVIADLATSALNAYGAETLSAVGATDVLTASVREGKLEADQLSGAMGSVLPIASAMGVQFHEVGAAFAAMSRTGTQAANASTQLNSIMMSIMKPTKDAQEALGELGLSSEGLRKQIKEKGLLSVFMTLKEASEENSQAFERVFGNVRALKGVMDLLGGNIESTKNIFEALEDTVGATDKAFDETRKSSSFKLRQAMVALQNTFTDLGATLLKGIVPIMSDLVGAVRGLFTRFKALEPRVQNIALAFAGLVVALPVLGGIFGAIGTAIGLLLSPITLLIAGLGAIAYQIYTNWNKVLPVITKIINYFIDLYNESISFRAVIETIILVFKTLWSIGQNVIGGLGDLFSNFGDFIMNLFGGIGDIIKGALTFDRSTFEKGFDALKESFFDVADIIAERGKIIGEEFSKNFNDAVENVQKKQNVPLVTDEQVMAIVQKGLDAGKGFYESFVEAVKKLNIGTGFVSEVSTEDEDTETNTTKKKADESTESVKKLTTATQILRDKMGQIGDAFGNAFIQGGNIAKNMLDTISGLIKQIIAELISALIKTAIIKFILGGTASFGDIFKGLITGGGKGATPFANGGIVSAPTLAMVGEYGGARNNPEVIAPLNKLTNLLPKQGNNNITGQVDFRIQGQQLVGILQKSERNRDRLV